MSEVNGPNVVTSGLVCCLDASNYFSYSGIGNTWYDVSGNNAHGQIVGTISFGIGSFIFPTSTGGNYILGTANTYVDFTMVIKPDFSANNEAGLAGLIGIGSNLSNSDKSLRIAGVNGTGPWSFATRNPGDANDWANPNATNYYVNGIVTNVLSNGWNIIGGYRTNQSVGFPTSFTYYLGTSGYNGTAPYREFKGNMAYVLLYNRQLTDSEQKQNFNALRTRWGL